MKIAVATNNKKEISEHFGSAEGFLIFEVEKDSIKELEFRNNQGKNQGQCGSCNHALMLENVKDCESVLSFGMGKKIFEDLSNAGIKPIISEERNIKKALTKLKAKNLKNCIEKLH